MTDNMKQFLELASRESEEYIKKLTSAEKDAVIALAAEKGFTLTDEDFVQEEPEGEVPLEEASSVAGGKKCYCVAGGGGKAGGKNDETCICVATGMGSGYTSNDYYMTPGVRCFCLGYGQGASNNR